MSRPRLQDFPNQAAWREAMAAWSESPEGMEAEAGIQRQREQEAKEQAAQERAELVAGIGVPEKDLKLINAGLVRETGATRALAPVDGVEYALVVLSGNPGCGKTTAASNWILGGKDGRPLAGSLFVKAAALARWDCYDSEQMDRLLLAPRLVIDDLGAEYMDAKGRFLSVLTEVIDVRYDAGRPTVITTWVLPEDFRTRYRERITDRIREVGLFMNLDGKSLRGRKS